MVQSEPTLICWKFYSFSLVNNLNIITFSANVISYVTLDIALYTRTPFSCLREPSFHWTGTLHLWTFTITARLLPYIPVPTHCSCITSIIFFLKKSFFSNKFLFDIWMVGEIYNIKINVCMYVICITREPISTIHPIVMKLVDIFAKYVVPANNAYNFKYKIKHIIQIHFFIIKTVSQKNET